MNAIKIEKLTKKYKNLTAVSELSLEIPENEVFALLGVNGAGKTTLIKMLCTVVNPTAGDAWVLGNSIKSDVARVKELINVSPQETAVAPNLSVRENLEFIYGIYGHSKAECRKRTDELIADLGLGDIQKSKAGTLSGGWQRRLSIAMAIVSAPRVLFLDEPTLGLDVLARRELWTVINQLKKKMTIVLTTHYLEEAESLCDRIAIMSRGRIVALGSAEQLMQEAGCDNFEDAFIKLCKGGDTNENA